MKKPKKVLKKKTAYHTMPDGTRMKGAKHKKKKSTY